MNDIDPTDFYAQEEAKEAISRAAKLEALSEEEDIKWLMSNRRGRRILWRILEQSGVFRSSFSTTAMLMAFNEGRREYGNWLLGTIHAYCPEHYTAMMKENTNVGRKSDGRSAPKQ